MKTSDNVERIVMRTVEWLTVLAAVLFVVWLLIPQLITPENKLRETAQSRVAQFSIEPFHGFGARRGERFFVRSVRTFPELPGMQQVFVRREPQVFGAGYPNEFSFWVPSIVSITKGEEVVPLRVRYAQNDWGGEDEVFYTLQKK